jgi:uroporphyrin-3 C-methyltransferase
MDIKMVQEHKEKRNALHGMKYVRLILTIVIILALAFVANTLWSRYNGQHSFATKQIEYLENKITTLSQGLPSNTGVSGVIKPLDETAVTDLQLRDAYFMVRIAATILQNDHDISAALELLNTAQEHLSNLQGEKIDKAKTILAADIAKLSAIQVADTGGVQQQLALLNNLATVLPLRHQAVESSPKDNALNDETSTAAAKQGRWQQSMQSVLSEVKTIVKIRKKPSGADAPLSEATIEIKHAHFRLLMEQVRWALFYKDSDVYKTSIHKMQQLVPEIFDIKSETVIQFTSILTEMSKVQINVDVPNIQESVNALKALLVG